MPRPGLIQPALRWCNYTGTVTDGGVLKASAKKHLAPTTTSSRWIFFCCRKHQQHNHGRSHRQALNTYYGTPGKYARSTVQGSQIGGAATTFWKRSQRAGIQHPGRATGGVGWRRHSHRVGQRRISASDALRVGPPVLRRLRPTSFTSTSVTTKLASQPTVRRDRNKEAVIIRNNSATLPSEHEYYIPAITTSTAAASFVSNHRRHGTNQGVDPLNPSGATGVDWTANSISKNRIGYFPLGARRPASHDEQRL